MMKSEAQDTGALGTIQKDPKEDTVSRVVQGLHDANANCRGFEFYGLRWSVWNEGFMAGSSTES